MPEKTASRTTTLRVDVTDVRGNTLRDAKVELRDAGGDELARLRLDEATGLFVADGVPAGEATIAVSHSGMETQTREVVVGEGPSEVLFLLAEPGVKTYFREKVRVPVDAEGDLIGLTLERKARREPQALDAFAKRLKLRERGMTDLAHSAGMRLYEAPDGDVAGALERLGSRAEVEHAGAVVSLRETGFTHMTQDVVVRLRRYGTNAARQLTERLGWELVRELPYAPSTVVLRSPAPADLELLDQIEKLASLEEVEWAEPSLVVSPELDSITPTDALWAGLWDRQLIGVQDAWQSLQDAGLDTFGDPDILLAVWDSGVQQVGGTPTNADFQGTLSNGQPKVFASFDFDNMVADNDNPWSDHGSGVAGVSVAAASNASPVPGQGFGLAGSAPNVQMMCVAGRTPYVDLEVSDQYVWMAGLDPASPIPGFPVPLARGADVITCSLTPGAGAPLSGTARAALDFVTTFGRQGKGTMCFFSTGNANLNNVTSRPWGAYEKSFGIAGTSFADDGVTEIRAPFSGWGQIALASPTQDALGTVHNPPTGFMPWSAAHAGTGNLISFPQVTTTTTAASALGATALSVASVAGLAASQVIHVGAIGALGSEPARITAVDPATSALTVVGFNGSFGGGLLNAHPSGTAVAMGPAGHRNNFGGTSSATPLCAGAAALVLSANPALTYIEARQILRDTAVRFDLANTDPVGQWLDAAGNPSVTSGLPAVRSGWYGYGRVDAAAAVTTAVSFAATCDLVIRDNLADTGAVASAGAFWNSPDIWCRLTDPASDPGALPGSYGVAGPHETPKRGQDNWVYLRVRNNGTAPSLDAWVRVSITHWPGTEFTWPAAFQPTNGPGDPLPSPLTPGTYFIGEAKVTGLAAGADRIVSVRWPSGLIPPETVTVGATTVLWHPCLLAEIAPHDGPAATGDHVWDDNNLAQKNISIVDADSGSDFAVGMVIGNELNESRHLVLEVIRGRLPREVRLYLDLVDPKLKRRLRAVAGSTPILHDPERPPPGGENGGVHTLPRRRIGSELISRSQTRWTIGFHDGREVVLLKPAPKQQIPVYAGPGQLQPVIVGGLVGRGARSGEYEVVVVQRDQAGQVSGSATLLVRVGKS